MRIWIVRKHAPISRFDSRRGFFAAFQIHKAYATVKEAYEEIAKRQPRSKFLYTVGYVELKGATNDSN